MTWLPYDPDLVGEVAAAMDLRGPNEAALTRVAEAIESGDGREVVCDLATGVGKTYLAAALIDYAARLGVRNVLIVVPGRTILDKTIANFTAGTPRYIDGASTAPLLITAENFQRGEVGDALHDPRRLKVFIFTVQVLLRPSGNLSRRTRTEDEFIGGALYDHLREVDDLLVIADEHHIYRQQASAFSAALRDLAPRALVGLTATPDASDLEKVIYRYSLAEAIRDEYVKVPVIAYRQDGLDDEETQLADACRLRTGKEQVWLDYAGTMGLPAVHPVLFVVCSEIADAERIAERLAAPDLLPGDGAVLLVTSQSSDAALAALEAVESPESPVRAIVSVNKLREGWDVRNIGVIIALRRLASETLTEQILGRGLRLPFGRRTGYGAIDQVDLVSHESYRRLLESKDALLERLTPPPLPIPPVGSGAMITGAPGPGLVESVTGFAIVGAHPEISDAPLLRATSIEAEHVLHDSERAAVGTMMQPVAGAPQILFPRRERLIEPIPFTIGSIDLDEVRSAGRRYRGNHEVPLTRRVLTAEVGLSGEVVRIVDQAAEGAIATQRWLPGAQVRAELIARLAQRPELPQTLLERANVIAVVEAFLEGAGVTEGDEADWAEPRAVAAEAALTDLVDRARLSVERRPNFRWQPVLVTGERPAPAAPRPWYDWSGPTDWYGPWDRSLVPFARFDSKSAEYALAQRLDASPGVRWWLRLYVPGEVWVATESDGRYHPDFIVIDDRGVYWLVEAKSDSAAEDDASVHRKATAAEAWAAAVRDERVYGEWRYLLVTESEIAAAPTWSALLT